MLTPILSVDLPTSRERKDGATAPGGPRDHNSRPTKRRVLWVFGINRGVLVLCVTPGSCPRGSTVLIEGDSGRS